MNRAELDAAGVIAVRSGPGGTCSAAGSAIDMLFYGSLAASTLLVALRALVPPEDPPADPETKAPVSHSRGVRDTEGSP